MELQISSDLQRLLPNPTEVSGQNHGAVPYKGWVRISLLAPRSINFPLPSTVPLTQRVIKHYLCVYCSFLYGLNYGKDSVHKTEQHVCEKIDNAQEIGTTS